MDHQIIRTHSPRGKRKEVCTATEKMKHHFLEHNNNRHLEEQIWLQQFQCKQQYRKEQFTATHTQHWPHNQAKLVYGSTLHGPQYFVGQGTRFGMRYAAYMCMWEQAQSGCFLGTRYANSLFALCQYLILTFLVIYISSLTNYICSYIFFPSCQYHPTFKKSQSR